MSIKEMAMSRTFAQAVVQPPKEAPHTLIPTGSWTLYFHEPEDKTWTPDSYKRLMSFSNWETLGSLLRELGHHKLLNGMLFTMQGDTSPLWENRANIRGGSYCLKVGRKVALDVYHRYLIAAGLGLITSRENPIVGVTMSPKRGFSIIKLWNTNAKGFNNPADIVLLHEEVKIEEILYRPHTDQKM